MLRYKSQIHIKVLPEGSKKRLEGFRYCIKWIEQDGSTSVEYLKYKDDIRVAFNHWVEKQ